MKTVCKNNLCTGCSVCLSCCGTGAIKIVDNIRNYNAIIDEKKCLGCNKCHKICPVNSPVLMNKPDFWKQGWIKNSHLRKFSSSGGVAFAIEKAFIENGGLVCSCIFEKGEFKFIITNNISELYYFAGSKYVKSNPGSVYLKIKKNLLSNQKVLFVGLPCQVAAVKSYIDKKYIKNLYTIDLICHGTPSPKILERYLYEHGIDIKNIKEIFFRTKNKFHIKTEQKFLTTPFTIDKYMIAFLNSISYTDNCYKCMYAKQERVSDLTLGDSWGTNLPKSVQKKGISLVLCQSLAGKELLDMADVELLDVDIDIAIKSNKQLMAPSSKPKKRELFLKLIFKNKSIDYSVFRVLPFSCIKQFIKAILVRMNLTWGGKIK